MTTTLLLLSSLVCAPVVHNSSFEDDGTEIRGIGYVAEGNPLTGWRCAGDKQAAKGRKGHAFFDNGLAPDGEIVCVLQNQSHIAQWVKGFEKGKIYRLSIRAAGRAADLRAYGRTGSLEIRLNGTTLLGPLAVGLADPEGVHENPFKEYVATIETGQGDFELTIHQTDEADGISVLFDDVQIVPVNSADDHRVIRINEAVPLKSMPSWIDDEGLLWSMGWIWTQEDGDPRQAAPAGKRAFRRRFRVRNTRRLVRAAFIGTCDNEARVFVNRRLCGQLNRFDTLYGIDLLDDLVSGDNVIAIEGFNQGDSPNPAGLAALILLESESGQKRRVIVSDSDWRGSGRWSDEWTSVDFDDSAWERAQVLGPMGISPWGQPGFLEGVPSPGMPVFRVPGFEEDMKRLRRLMSLHWKRGGPAATLWDEWMSLSSLWPATALNPDRNPKREAWRRVLLSRRIDEEGYVSTHQHHGFGHGEGWPFPTCFQAKGVGWQFGRAALAYNVSLTDSLDGWETERLSVLGFDERTGLRFRCQGGRSLLTTPLFSINHFVAPFVRLEWEVQGREQLKGAALEWTTKDEPSFSEKRRIPFSLPADGNGIHFVNVPLYKHPAWGGTLTRFRFSFDTEGSLLFSIQGIISATDNRHNVNNANYLQGCDAYFRWTGDISFLQENMGRMRKALAYAIEEFDLREAACVQTPWIGHDGRSGWTRHKEGKRTIHYGRGIGCNYWDLLPFGGHDALATAYLFDALRRMARLERSVAAHPKWNIRPCPANQTADVLDALAERIRKGMDRFWVSDTGRFAPCIDADGLRHDYGYTFLNCEIMYYDLATSSQERSILDWLSGKRIVQGDTSVGDDIYAFRFGPRASTRRNIEWYTFPWQHPEGIPWGHQVQDGGAVLGFAYHELMARLRVNGPDDAWERLQALLEWFQDVQDAGGYRAYYSDPSLGTLQGGGTPGGLGLDHEFIESLLVPQVLLYGFAGFQALPDGLLLDPRLPPRWPFLEITRIHYHDVVLSVKVTKEDVSLTSLAGEKTRLNLHLPSLEAPVSVLLRPGRTVHVRLGKKDDRP